MSGNGAGIGMEDYLVNPLPPPNYTGPDSGQRRVLRGGSWDYSASYARVSDRRNGYPGDRFSICGFRLTRAR